MAEELSKRIMALEKGLKKSVVDRNRQMNKMHVKIQTLATRGDLEHAMEGVVKKTDLSAMTKEFVPRAEIDAFQATVATKDDIAKVTRSINEVAASVKEVVDLVKNFKIGVHVGGRIFGFSGRFLLWTGAAITAVAAWMGGLHWFATTYIWAKVVAILHL